MSTTSLAQATVALKQEPHPPSRTTHPQVRRRSRWWLVFLIVVGLPTGWLVLGALPRTPTEVASAHLLGRRSFPVVIEAKGELKAKNSIDIKSKVEGRSTIIWVIEEGTTVAEGELLVRLASDEIEDKIRQEEASEASAIAALEAAVKDLEILIDQNKADIRKAEWALEAAQIDSKKYTEGDAKKAQMDAELEIERTQQMYERAKLDFDAAKQLKEQNFITTSELLRDEFELKEAIRSLEKAKLSMEILEKYTYPKDMRQRESDVQEATKDLERVRKSALAKEAQKHADVEAKKANLLNIQTNLKKLREQNEFCEIKAPSPGLVVFDTGHRWDPRKITEGSEVFERQTIVTLPDPSVMIVSVRIHEAKTNQIELGQQVNVDIEGVPGRKFTGKVSKIAPLADSRNQWLNPDLKEYETEITLDQSEESLKPGMTARAEIIVAELTDVPALPLQSVYSKAGKQYVFHPDGKGGEPVEVQLGQSGNEFVEVLSGISVGQKVLLAISDEAKRRLPDTKPGEANAADVSSGRPKAQTSSGGSRGSRPGGRSQRRG